MLKFNPITFRAEIKMPPTDRGKRGYLNKYVKDIRIR